MFVLLYESDSIQLLDEIGLSIEDRNKLRIRGIINMKDKSPIDIEKEWKEQRPEIGILMGNLNAIPRWRTTTKYTLSHGGLPNSEYRKYVHCNKYVNDLFALEYSICEERQHVSIKWENIHGKYRKQLKFQIKQLKKEFIKQYEMFNKYCGTDTFMILSKTGKYNWSGYTHKDFKDNKWYLDSCDDYFDYAFSNIYITSKVFCNHHDNLGNNMIFPIVGTNMSKCSLCGEKFTMYYSISNKI